MKQPEKISLTEATGRLFELEEELAESKKIQNLLLKAMKRIASGKITFDDETGNLISEAIDSSN